MKQVINQLRKTTKNIIGAASVLMLSSVIIIGCNKNDGDYGKNPPPPAGPKSKVVKGAGDITAQLTEFRKLLGDSLNTVPGKTSGRREINWDAVPANLTNNNNFPFDFFNSTDPAVAAGRKRGLVMNSGTNFRVDSTNFDAIDASYATQFKAFSPKKTFVYITNTVSTAFFKVPGASTDAFVKGFGVIFSDVDDANSTTLEFFNGNNSLGIFKAPVRSDANGFSFLGVYFPDEKVTKVKITAGNGLLGAGVKDITNGGTKDLVVMDDFFYNEPLPQ